MTCRVAVFDAQHVSGRVYREYISIQCDVCRSMVPTFNICRHSAPKRICTYKLGQRDVIAKFHPFGPLRKPPKQVPSLLY